MSSNSECVRHGLYIPIELLSRIKEIARKEKKSINKKIEMIIQDWFDFQKSKDSSKLSREEFHKLPLWRKRQILSEQANNALEHYSKDDDWKQLQGDDIFEY
ncbi:MAG: hypothetical protein HQM08_20740 [Candidatus Riflebacteria bacterium]|nr:hypothetical protein [Candidatus Riflebacteria bacterium]